MSLECDDRRVSFERLRDVVITFRHFVPSVVPGSGLEGRPDIGLCLFRGEMSHVPELQALILRVAEKVSAVILRIDVGDSIDVSQQNARSFRIVFVQASSIPHSNARVIAAGVKQLRRFIDESNTIDVCHHPVVPHWYT